MQLFAHAKNNVLGLALSNVFKPRLDVKLVKGSVHRPTGDVNMTLVYDIFRTLKRVLVI